MIEFNDVIMNNQQFKSICSEKTNGNSFMFLSQDKIYLENFALSFAKFLLCQDRNKKLPCEKCLSCMKANLLSHPDLMIYPKGNSGTILVDDIKNLIENANLTPIEADKKVFVFKNFSNANIQSQNKLLKILEEPPKNVFIILCVNNSSKVLPTILSRCEKINLNNLSNEEISKCLNKKTEKKELQEILEISQGLLTNALNYSNNVDFLETFKNCLNILQKMKDSTELLKYSVTINKSKEIFEMALNIFEVIFRDILLVRLGKNELVSSKDILEDLKGIVNSYDCDAVDKIIRKIYFIKKQIEFNCNYIFLCDNLLLYVLEVRFLCNKK